MRSRPTFLRENRPDVTRADETELWKETQISNRNASTQASNSIQDGIRHAPGGGAALMNAANTALLLLDHQTGLFQTVKDISVSELRANTAMLAKLAALMKVPLV